MDEADGKERAGLIGWILGEEWTVAWTGGGVLVQPNRPKSHIQPCMQHFLASKPDAAYVCDLIDEAVMRRENAYEVKAIRSHRGDITVNLRFRDQPGGTVRYRNYKRVARNGLEARLETLRLLRKADADG